MQVKHLILCLMLLHSTQQYATAQGVYFRFGNLDTMVTSDKVPHKAVARWPEVLANTKFVFVGGQAEWKVNGYHLSFRPEGGDLRGPYIVRGNEWTDEIKRVAKEKLMEYPKTKVYIDAIRIKGPDHVERIFPSPLSFTVEP